jgi:hypothetical protein
MEAKVWRAIWKRLKGRLVEETPFTSALRKGELVLVAELDSLTAALEFVKHPSANSFTFSVCWTRPGHSLADLETDAMDPKQAMREPLAAVRIGRLMGHKGDYWWNSQTKSLTDAVLAEAGLAFDRPFPGNELDEGALVDDVLDAVTGVVIPFLEKLR